MLRLVDPRYRFVVIAKVRNRIGRRNKAAVCQRVAKLDSQADACWTREPNYP